MVLVPRALESGILARGLSDPAATEALASRPAHDGDRACCWPSLPDTPGTAAGAQEPQEIAVDADFAEHGLFVKIREEKGANKMAACGQLGNVALKRTLMLKRRMERMMQREAAEAEEEEAEAADATADAAAAAASVEPEPPEGAYPVRLCGREDLSW